MQQYIWIDARPGIECTADGQMPMVKGRDLKLSNMKRKSARNGAGKQSRQSTSTIAPMSPRPIKATKWG
eukprot:9430703-Pyramimonas_sp.AAC.1